ncbi:MAG: hypothetical protein JXA30_19320 [Deltaproteobacteria bacterium]|nr:hypothetical protein [Deltaproteobacteria bacterium]
MKTVNRIGFVLLLSISETTLSAQPVQQTSDSTLDPLAAIVDADPMELARVVRRIGDNAVIERLEEDKPIEVRIAAIRATRWMRAPERALAALAEEVGSRDCDLAPAAARAALRIASELTADELATREVMPEQLRQARALFAQAAKNALLRPDIRLYAAQTQEALRAAGVP